MVLSSGHKPSFIEAICQQALFATARLSSETLSPYWGQFSDMIAIYFGYKEPKKKNFNVATKYVADWQRELRKKGSPLHQILFPYVEVFDKSTLSRPDNPLDWDHTGHMPYQCFSNGWDGLMAKIAEIPMPELHRHRVDQIYSYAASMVLNQDGEFVEKGVIGISIGKCLPHIDDTLEMMLRKALQRGLYIPLGPDKQPWQKNIRIPKGKAGNDMRRMLGNALCRRKNSPFLAAHKLVVGSEILLNDNSAVIAEDIHPNLSIETLAHHFDLWRSGRILKINKEIENKLSINTGSYKPRLKQEKHKLQTSYSFGSFAQYKFHSRDKKPQKRVVEYSPSYQERADLFAKKTKRTPSSRLSFSDKEQRRKNERINIKAIKQLSIRDLEREGLTLNPNNVIFRVSDKGALSSSLTLSTLERHKYAVKRGQVVLGAKTIQITKLPVGRYKIIRSTTYDSAGYLIINENGIIKIRRDKDFKIVLSDGVVSYIKRINKERRSLVKKI